MATNWGIMATGAIAHTFAEDFSHCPTGKLVGVSSRTPSNAEEFADKFELPMPFESHAELASSDFIDVVYIASPHPQHYSMAKLCLEHGKHVLCEKPLAINAEQTRELFQLAEKNQCFLMEALWTRFNPSVLIAKELIEEGEIGEVKSIQANFGFVAPDEPGHRLTNPELGGGALLDIGIYPLFLAQLLLGRPDRIQSRAQTNQQGIDIHDDIWLDYDNGATASISISLSAQLNNDATISGTEGSLYFPAEWYCSQKVILTRTNGEQIEMPCPFPGMGYHLEVFHVNDCIRQGLLQSPMHSKQDSLNLIETMDSLRAQWGLRYPFE